MKAEEFVNKYYQLPESKIQTVKISSLIKCLERFEQEYACQSLPSISEEEITKYTIGIYFDKKIERVIKVIFYFKVIV